MKGQLITSLAFLALIAAAGVPHFLTRRAHQLPPSPTELEAALEVVIPKFELDEVRLEDAINLMAARLPAGTKVNVDWPAMEAAGCRRDSLVSVYLRDATLATVLDNTLFNVGVGPLRFETNGDTLTVGAAWLLDGTTTVRVYDVRDVLARADFIHPEDLVNTYQPCFGPPVPPEITPTAVLGSLVSRNIAPMVWRGGTPFAIEPFGEQLYVAHTSFNQRRVRSFLNDLRKRADGTLADWAPDGCPSGPDRDGRAREADAALARVRLATFKQQSTFRHAVEALSADGGIDIFADWHLLDLDTKASQFAVNVDLHDISLPEALRAVIQSTEFGNKLDFAVSANGLEVFDRDYPAVMTRVYDVRPLLAAAMATNRDPERGDAEVLDQLMRLCTDNIDSDGWQINGGLYGSISEQLGMLYIDQTWANHQQLAALFQRVAKEGMPAATIELSK